MYRFSLTQLHLCSGDIIAPSQITVVVGPNNSGKSRFLKDIIDVVTNRNTDRLLVKNAECAIPACLKDLRDSYHIERRKTKHGAWAWSGINPDLSEGFDTSGGLGSWPDAYEHQFSNVNRKDHHQWLFANFGQQLIAHLTTEYRLQLIKEQRSPNTEYDRSNLLHEYYYGDNRVLDDELRDVISQAFKTDIALDYTSLQRMLFRVGEDFSGLSGNPRKDSSTLSQCKKLDEQGDGIRAFAGVVVALLAVRRDVFLIDEPEAFLHPPQSFRLGRFLSDQSCKNRQIIVATHSADILRGLLSIPTDIKIIRIDRSGSVNTIRTLDTNTIKSLVTDPLLSSARVLDGLFYSGAVVVEADADARFYQAASVRLKNDIDLHFVNADNKQTVPRIMSIYNNVGVRCAGIVDFDALNNAAEFKRQIESIGLESGAKQEACAIREQIASAADETPVIRRIENLREACRSLLNDLDSICSNSQASVALPDNEHSEYIRKIDVKLRGLPDTTKAWKDYKQRGRSALPLDKQLVFDRLNQLCSSKGLFINPYGELESLLVEYGQEYTTDKRAWIARSLVLLPQLAPDAKKCPWALLELVHCYLTGK